MILACLAFCFSCDDPYENIPDDKSYNGKPFVSLSSESGVINLNGTTKGALTDSVALSHRQDHDITVTLELVERFTVGEVGTHFTYENNLTIPAGAFYGHFKAEALDVKEDGDVKISDYKLSVRIKSVDDPNIIPGLYGNKLEGEERQKRYKTISFRK
ncbi:hypothetical protein FUAX_44670 (plasmid) [Fulvitalea axinellae]|uniref:DUF3823 domain-containing protein n=2 Tax=Fulvitalea axinellae TaxID=1182444 RepID=A0AAU9CRN2_9BACT|nr:hypothetical protein FUAX_44670 [Fulvitalea axinellae]